MPKKPPPPELVKQFSSALAALREAKGWTIPELALRAGCHRQAIYKLEAGEQGPTWATVVALADALGCSTEAFRGEGSKHETQVAAARDEVREMREWLAAAPSTARKGRGK